MVTAYDASFAAAADAAGIDIVLVGDSLGMVVQGHASTLPVTVDQMVYHSAAAARGVARALLIADMPFLSARDSATALAHRDAPDGRGRRGDGEARRRRLGFGSDPCAERTRRAGVRASWA